ncbi:MAG: endonuclease/exonuclease/phosphatase family protein [Acidimicrobiales bacterium]
MATYNVRHGRPRRGFTSNRWLARAVARIDADVLAVQEVERRVVRSWFADQRALLAEAAGATDTAYAPARRLAVLGSDGVALLVRGRLLDHEVVRFAGRAGRQDRVAVVAGVEVGGRSLTAVATHLQDEAGEARDQLASLLGALVSRPRPCVLLGDLNLATSDVGPACAAAGFTLAGGPPSAPAERPFQRIDHIATAGIGIGTVSVLHLPVSDHRAVVAELVG